jgi:hypothetical protein
VKTQPTTNPSTSNPFVEHYRDDVIGILHGFDRLRLRGTLRQLYCPRVMEAYMRGDQFQLKTILLRIGIERPVTLAAAANRLTGFFHPLKERHGPARRRQRLQIAVVGFLGDLGPTSHVLDVPPPAPVACPRFYSEAQRNSSLRCNRERPLPITALLTARKADVQQLAKIAA